MVELVELVELGGVGFDPTLFRHFSDTSGNLYIWGRRLYISIGLLLRSVEKIQESS